MNARAPIAIIVLAAGLVQSGCGPEISAPLPDVAAASSAPAASAPPPPDSATAAAALRELAGAPARVVWVQDLGDGTDTGLESDNLRLMGFDSGDKRGEHAILAAPGNYARPLITPQGDRVIFSDRHARRIMLVHWDGGGLRPLCDGLALAVWMDAAGREWVYYGAEPGRQRLVPAVYRCLVDNPAVIEPVWERTAAGLNNFQLAADGGRAGGVFPWPDCGVADLATGGLRIYGKGCYPALAPDDSGLFWIFDGAHRNLLFFQADTDGRWRVPINTAPEIGGYEVYYPRWSNQARFMVMTGPFKVGTGDNRIRGGGLEVEVYVGRFSADFRRVEQWVRVSYNGRGDFYPDLWVAPAPAGAAAAPAAPRPPPAAAVTPAPWPARRDNLVFIWENRARPNETAGPAGAVIVCGVEPKGRARFGRNFEMLADRGAFTAAPAAARRALAACREAGAMTLELVVTPGAGGPRPAGVICAMGAGSHDWNLLLGERNARLVCMPRRAGGAPGAELDLGALPPGRPNQVSLTCAAGALACRLNGAETFQAALPGVELGAWRDGPLVFGAAPDGSLPWAGLIEGVALYSRALPADEAARNYRAIAQRLAQRSPPPPAATADARLAAAPAIPAPAEIAPYRRALAVNRYQLARKVAGAELEPEFLVAEWVIMDGAVLPEAARTPGRIYRLRLEKFNDHPELEGERLIMEGDAWELPLYYPADG